MPRLEAQYTSAFSRDVKRLRKQHIDDAPLAEVIELIMENTPEAKSVLRHRHRMHTLSGKWSESSECHVCNAGDWLLIWTTFDNIALIQRTGSHDELFRK